MKKTHRFPWRLPSWGVRLSGACLFAAAPALALYGCGPGDPCLGTGSLPVQTLEEFAAECNEATDIEIPEFECDNGTQVPENNLSGNYPNQFCDAPNVLRHECDPESRFQVVKRTADAIVVAHCRKQNHGVDPTDGTGRYGDIAIIQYNKSTGTTCFYQALAGQGPAGPHLPSTVKPPILGAGADAGGDAGKFPWLQPADTASIGCVYCHDNGPFVRSPYLAQLRDAGENPVTGSVDQLPGTNGTDLDWGSSGWNATQPYKFVGNAFQSWKVYKVSAAGSSCTGCHRLGVATIDGLYSTDQDPAELKGTAMVFGPEATAAQQKHKNPHSAASPIWMKPGQVTYDAGVEQEAWLVQTCAVAIALGADPLPPGCEGEQYGQGISCSPNSPQAASAQSAVHFSQPKEVKGEGSCMCSLCWSQPFCFDPTRPEGSQVYPVPCDEPEHEAEDASRVVGADVAKQGGFYCAKPFPDAVMNATGNSCPSDEPDRAKVENFDVCIDAPVCARPVAECGPHTNPACSQEPRTARPSVRVPVPDYEGNPFTIKEDAARGATALVSQLVGACSQFGGAPPSGAQPERYCYLSCVNAHDCTLDPTSPRCLGTASISTVQSVVGTFPVDIDPMSTAATVYFKNLSGAWQAAGSMAISGRIHFQVPRECQGPDRSGTCAATMTRMALASVGSMTLGGVTLSNVRLLNENPAVGTFATVYADGTFSIPAHTKLALTGDVPGQPYRYVNVDPTTPIATSWDWVTRIVSLDATFVSPDARLKVVLSGLGTFDSLPPTSVATANPTTVTCGRTTRLSALSSTDPDGASDIKSVTWTTDRKDGNDWQASGMTVDVHPDVGTTRYYAKVVDSAGSTHTSYVDVTMSCNGCADSTADELFTLGVVGCGGTKTWDQRATLCSTGFAACTAGQWNAYRGDTIPTNDYWTNDNLRYAGSATACQAVYTGGSSCGTNRPMRVCTPDGTDSFGNTCTWTGCGLSSTDDDYLGGCVSNPTAGTLCCAQPVCAGGAAPTDVFTPGMIGCGGTKTWDQRATLCGAGYTPCTAAQWNAYRGDHVPSKNYWTNDNLGYAGSASACKATSTGGTSCGTNRPMRVCTPGGTDSYGNTCTWKGCGLDTTDNEYFGGCVSNPTAGTLCCAL